MARSVLLRLLWLGVLVLLALMATALLGGPGAALAHRNSEATMRRSGGALAWPVCMGLGTRPCTGLGTDISVGDGHELA